MPGGVGVQQPGQAAGDGGEPHVAAAAAVAAADAATVAAL